MTQCGPCGPLPAVQPAGVVTIVQGYEKIFFFNLFYQFAGVPYDLTGATQIVVSLPAAPGGPAPAASVNEYLTPQLVLETTGNITASSDQLTNLASVVGLFVGQVIVATGVPTGTTILSLSGSTATMSQDATATTTGVLVTVNTATNVAIAGAAGAGAVQVTVPAADSARLLINPYPPQYQDLQVSVTNANGSISAFVLSSVINIIAPPFGVV